MRTIVFQINIFTTKNTKATKNKTETKREKSRRCPSLRRFISLSLLRVLRVLRGEVLFLNVYNYRFVALGLAIAFLLVPLSSPAAAQRLKVTENRRYLQYENSKPFFYLGDTAWELFHRLNREEATQYLTNRAGKGFTVIQAVVLAQLGGLTVPNPYNDLPLVNGDPAKPNEAYFRHVDFIVNKAEELGLYVGMLPTWGSHWALGKAAFNPANARQYGHFLGQRYKDKAIIWVLGGDRSITNDDERAIIDAMAARI